MWSSTSSNISLSKFVKNVLIMNLLIPLGKKEGTLEKAHRF